MPDLLPLIIVIAVVGGPLVILLLFTGGDR